jgi:transposase InsO family protein
MRFEGVSEMKQRRQMLDAVDSGDLTVTEACALWRVSRQTFYVWRRRCDSDGDAGLKNRSSRPRRSPGRIAPLLEGQIVDMRRAHPRWGARRIRVELRRRGVTAVPARSTVHQVLIRNGLVRVSAPTPPEPVTRFVRSKANELWQMDATEVELRDGTAVEVISALDDHSRCCGHVEAFAALSGEAACAVFDVATSLLGLPESVLCDNGAIFTGRVKHCVNLFERHVWSHGVYTLNGRARHPQTQGKVERYHRTLNEWLTDHGPFDTIDELNASLGQFRHHYNHERPHQGDGMNDQTPAEAFAAATTAGPDPTRAAQRCQRETVRRTTPTGNVGYGEWTIGLGRVWGRTQVRVVDYGATIEIYSADGDLIRAVKPDHTRTYLGTGNPRGRPHRRDNV